MPYRYPATVTVYDEEVVVTFRDLPGVAGGATREEALKEAEVVLEVSLGLHLDEGLDIPPASPAKPNDVMISVTRPMIARLARAGDDQAEDEMAERLVAEAKARGDVALPIAVWDEIADAPSPIGPLRKYMGQTQLELATAAGISQDHLSQLETGEKSGDIDTLLAIAKALGVGLQHVIKDADR